jgi:hypothetical protein
MRLKAGLTPAAEKHLREALQQKLANRAEQLSFGLHQEILDTTPVNSGRTLASWKLTRGKASNYDAGDFDDFFIPIGDGSPTNSLPIGSEPGRDSFEQIAKEGREKVVPEKGPIGKIYISNAAKIDSWFESTFSQSEPGLRASLQNAGIVPDYDWKTGRYGAYDKRGQGMFERAIAAFLRNYKHYIKG